MAYGYHNGVNSTEFISGFYIVKHISLVHTLQIKDYYYIILSLKYHYSKSKIILNAQKIVIDT